MASRIIDPQRFLLHAAITDWHLIARRSKQDIEVARLAKERGIGTRMVQLRWLMDPKLGYPTEPFTVWRRPSRPMEGERAFGFSTIGVMPATQMIHIERTLCFARMKVQASGNALLVAYAGAPFNSAVVEIVNVQDGLHDYVLSANAISTLVIYGNADLHNLTGITGEDASHESQEWKVMETVGLPADPSHWSGIFDLDRPQGLPGLETDPREAALARFNRGAALFGWPDMIAAGKPAPAWKLANPKAIIQGYGIELDPHLRRMIANHPPEGHCEYGIEQNMDVNDGAGHNADTRYKPICTLMLGAASDPLFSLVAGFGTAFEDERYSIRKPLHGDYDRSDWDYMVTAYYAKGLDGQSPACEYAALIRAPGTVNPPPAPAGLAAFREGLTPPEKTDGAYKGVIGLSWDKLPDMTPFRIASYAFARTGITPAKAVVSLLEDRIFDPHVPHPVSATTSPENEQATGKLYALDENYTLDSTASPNRLHYGVVHQDIFGLWSGWADTTFTLDEPPVQSARILSLRLDTVAGASPVCDATLVVDIAWDWSVRAPAKIELASMLYAAAKPGSAPPPTGLAPGFQKAFPATPATQEPNFTISFDAHGKATPSYGTLKYITDDSKGVQDTPVLTQGPRRYRLTIPHFKLAFASSGHIGIALWAKGQERRLPNTQGPWSAEPKATTASDPRPPVMLKVVEPVELASLPDGNGEHRVRLDWGAVAGATGYSIYETTESAFRAFLGMGEAPAGKTMAERLALLRAQFQTHPERRVFTRVNAEPITAQEAEVIIPRGSKEIHMYVITGTSAGQIESPWPEPDTPANPPAKPFTTGKKFRAFAAPQIASPTQPMLEVRRNQAGASFHAAISIQTRAGAKVSRIELFRTRVPQAALNVDTMGLPVATITSGAAGWTVVPHTETGQSLGIVTGNDMVEGSWKRVFYRAVAWSNDQPEKALYGGRSDASPAVEVIVPPATPPALGSIIQTLNSANALPFACTVKAAVPLEDTALGPHRLRVEALNEAADGTLSPVFSWPAATNGAPKDRMADVSTVADSGLWRTGTDGDVTLHLHVAKKTVADRVRVRVLLTDPLGRSTEKTFLSAVENAPQASFSDVKITEVTSKGYILTFRTDAPLETTYKLDVAFTPAITRLQRPLKQTFSALLPQIPILPRTVDPFASTVKLPVVRNVPVNGATTIAVYMRSKGQVNVVLTGPKNRQITLTRKVP